MRVSTALMVAVCLGLAAPVLAGDEPSPDRVKQLEEARKLNNDGYNHYLRGNNPTAARMIEQAVAARRKLYPPDKFPDGHRELAVSLGNLGLVYDAQAAFAKAQPLYEESVAMLRRLFPPATHPNGDKDLATILGNLGQCLQSQGQAVKALPHLEEALAMQRRLHPPEKEPNGSIDVSHAMNNLAMALRPLGQTAKATRLLEEALAINRKLYPAAKFPDGHMDLARGMANLGFALLDGGDLERAAPLFGDALAMLRKLYPATKFPKGHLELARGLSNYASILQRQGEIERARDLMQEGLDMRRRIFPESEYPNGHPQLAYSLSNVALILQATGDYDRAFPLYEQALAMMRKLYPADKYPRGHPELATALLNLGFALCGRQEYARAVPYYEESVAMLRRLVPAERFPNGHPLIASFMTNLGFAQLKSGNLDAARQTYEAALKMQRALFPESKFPAGQDDIAHTLINLGAVWRSLGDPAKELDYTEQAYALRSRLFPKQLYPDGHRILMENLDNLGFAWEARGDYARALSYFTDALAMYRRLSRRTLLASSESEALAFVQSQPLLRDAYLSVAEKLPKTEAAAYRVAWDAKAEVTRILELRRAATRAGGTDAGRVARLKEIRRQIEKTLQNGALAAELRDKELARLTDERDSIERELARDVPALSAGSETGPDDLAKALPPGTAFVDLIAYTRFGHDPKSKEPAHETRTAAYVAFVLAPGAAPQRVELGPAAPIIEAVRDWRKAIERRDKSASAVRLRELVWDAIARHVPPGTKTLYLSPDGDLARTPWAALPLADGRVLLEQFALAIVPHGPFLLQHLKATTRPDRDDTLLTAGGLSYGDGWPALPGTEAEVAALTVAFPGKPVALTKADVTKERLAAELPKARWAHLATHGEFKAAELAAERGREVAAARQWREGSGEQRRRVAARNPLGFVGVVLSGGEIMSGLTILDLDLERLNLITLSACETGLGDLTGGEGVQGLQRAFHLAGCPNVVASLWKVNDAATAALMAKFYDELWTKKKPPIEALREAQLTIYRHPELIKDLAGERGAPKAKDALAVKSSDPAAAQNQTRSDTKLWAAFVLSGVGK